MATASFQRVIGSNKASPHPLFCRLNTPRSLSRSSQDLCPSPHQFPCLVRMFYWVPYWELQGEMEICECQGLLDTARMSFPEHSQAAHPTELLTSVIDEWWNWQQANTHIDCSSWLLTQTLVPRDTQPPTATHEPSGLPAMAPAGLQMTNISANGCVQEHTALRSPKEALSLRKLKTQLLSLSSNSQTVS